MTNIFYKLYSSIKIVKILHLYVKKTSGHLKSFPI